MHVCSGLALLSGTTIFKDLSHWSASLTQSHELSNWIYTQRSKQEHTHYTLNQNNEYSIIVCFTSVPHCQLLRCKQWLSIRTRISILRSIQANHVLCLILLVSIWVEDLAGAIEDLGVEASHVRLHTVIRNFASGTNNLRSLKKTCRVNWKLIFLDHGFTKCLQFSSELFI